MTKKDDESDYGSEISAAHPFVFMEVGGFSGCCVIPLRLAVVAYSSALSL